MGLRNLKSIFRKGKPGEQALSGIIGDISGICIEDADGNVVFGVQSDLHPARELQAEGRTLGTVYGPDNIADFVQFLVDKEQEKK